jgi:hypothetical protein
LMAAGKLLLKSHLTCGLELIQVLCGCQYSSTSIHPCNSKDFNSHFSACSYVSRYKNDELTSLRKKSVHSPAEMEMTLLLSRTYILLSNTSDSKIKHVEN